MKKNAEKSLETAITDELTIPEGKSLDDVTRMIYDAFDVEHRSRYAQPDLAGPCWVEEVFEDHVIAREADKHYRIKYSVEGEKVTFAPHEEWEAVIEKSEWISVPDELAGDGLRANTLLAVELSDDALVDGKAFDGLTTGDFIDMRGSAVKIKTDDLEECLANTLSAIEATKSESGEIVGLPIDAHGHEKGDGAGWIVGASLEDGKLRLVPKWTEIGRELIGKGIRRFFSATVDTANKVILGGTLTNWPAVRDKKGRVLLRPVELTQKLEVDMTEDQMNELIDKRIAAITAASPANGKGTSVDLTSLSVFQGMSEEDKQKNLEELRQYLEMTRKQAELQYRQEIARLQFEGKMIELAQELTGGTEAAPRGYHVAAEELQAHLVKLDQEEAKFWGDLLRKAQKDGFVEYGEVGHGKEPKGLKSLPAEFAAKLDAGVLAVTDLATPEAGLGDLAQYDLSKWKK